MIEKVFFKVMDTLGPYEKNPHLAVAVSGGSDSLCLAILAQEWANNRGGKITVHSPGQKVVYFVLNLNILFLTDFASFSNSSLFNLIS